MNKEIKITVFREKQSQAWFYVFDKGWVVYRSGRGYATKEAAEGAGLTHWQTIDAQEAQ